MSVDWAEFNLAIAGAAGALTGLLFIAVSIRPQDIRATPLLMGRARSAFYAFALTLFASTLALAPTPSRLVGVAQAGIAIIVMATSASFTRHAHLARQLNYLRAGVYHTGMVVIAGAGVMRALDADPDTTAEVLATGTLLLLGIAVSNAWQLVLSLEPDRT